ncbi:hypothetical protein ACEZ3G_05385 [Maribacter algicola]|uniref:Uncharacterized protein n=1 Tax=Meishania litoralis TaxID=3434685 RepID=A0ACC7LI66_9FLAO
MMKNVKERLLLLFMFIGIAVHAQQLTPEQQKQIEEAQKIQDSLMNSPVMKQVMEQVEEQMNQQSDKDGEDSPVEPSSVAKGTLSIDGNTYNYQTIDRKKSRIHYDEGVWLELYPPGAPVIVFEFPTIERWSAIRTYEFELPGFNEVDGREPLVFNIKKDGRTFVFEGPLHASLILGLVTAKFKGVGKSADGKVVPISGEFKVSI